jgi:hypothetical protein
MNAIKSASINRNRIILAGEYDDEDYSIACTKDNVARKLEELNPIKFSKGTIQYSLGSFEGEIEVPYKLRGTQTIRIKYNILIPR